MNLGTINLFIYFHNFFNRQEQNPDKMYIEGFASYMEGKDGSYIISAKIIFTIQKVRKGLTHPICGDIFLSPHATLITIHNVIINGDILNNL